MLAGLMSVLVVEDEERMAELLRSGLREHGYTVMTVPDGESGLALARNHNFDVVVLDLMLPGMSGWEVMRELRKARNSASVLMLTACDSEPDVIEGLESGADDYLTKPFSFQELLARLHCLARARNSTLGPVLRLDTLELDLTERKAYRAERRLDLTRTEFGLLMSLLKQQGRVVSRAELLQMVWGDDPPSGRSGLDSFISLLRKKVDLPGERKLMHTVKGAGYSLRVHEQWLHAGQQPSE
jgi:two-component system, OmpR family, copper resistance phosphate regulon response regulator CusR